MRTHAHQSAKKLFAMYQNAIWLLTGVLLACFANGRWIIPIATWLAPIFFQRFMRKAKFLPAVIFFFLSQILIFCFSWLPLVLNLPFVFSIILPLLSASLWLIPYLIDRIVAQRISSWLSIFTLPAAVVVIEYAHVLLSPYTMYNTYALTQTDNTAFIQFTSIFGIWGITFLLFWFASLVNWIWDNTFDWISVKKPVVMYCFVLIVILLYGGARMCFHPVNTEKVRIAGISVTPYSGTIENHEKLFDLTEKQARADARIICWSEFVFRRIEEEEAQILLNKAIELAQKHHIYLIITYSINGYKGNHAVVIGPDGSVLHDYCKKHYPGNPYGIGREADLQTLATPYGRISVLICMDILHPHYLRQIRGTDIVFNPSSEEEIENNPYTTRFAAVLSAQHGVSIIKPTAYNPSVVYDYFGRPLSYGSWSPSSPKVIMAEVPIKGMTSLYAYIGDVFAWICLIFLIGLLSMMTRRKLIRAPY